MAQAAVAEPGYRFTTGHKTRVWSDLPGQDNTLTWAGARDEEGFATGDGTLTFYQVNWKRVTGSSIPTGKPTMVRQLSGRMVKGKFEGIVAMAMANGITAHAKFAAGAPAGKWLDGGAPDTEKTKTAQGPTAKEGSEQASIRSEVAPPAEGPSPSATIEINRTETSANVEDTKGSGAHGGRESLSSLIAPPSSLPKTDARLSRAEVIRAADEEAMQRGLKAGDYHGRNLKYDAAAGTWTVFYDRPSDQSEANARKEFAVTVEDKTSKASVAPEE